MSFGDGATNQGSLHEGIAFSAYRRLPLVLVCENNGWSEMTPISRTTPLARLADRAEGYGIPGISVDADDPEVVREAMAEAVERARADGGPTLLECRCHRLWGHYNGDTEHYRPEDDR